MLDDLGSVAWGSLAQPTWNLPDTVPSSLVVLASCASEATSRDAYNRVLYALGNNHAGTYYPVVLSALPFLGKILECGGNWARIAALDILIDLSASFEPEPGFEIVTTSSGEPMELSNLLRERTADLRGVVRKIAAGGAAGDRERALAMELLNYLEEDRVDS